MAEQVKEVEVRLTLQRSSNGYSLIVPTRSGKYNVISLEGDFRGPMRKSLVEWAEEVFAAQGLLAVDKEHANKD